MLPTLKALHKTHTQAYTALSTAASNLEGPSFCFMCFKTEAGAAEDGAVEVIPLTKRQKGLVNGGCEVMGRKIKPPEDPTSKTWLSAYGSECC